MVGQSVSHYRILEKLGEGGMGQVYLAQDTRLGRKVALKFISEARQSDPVARRRLLSEAKSAAALDHAFICKIYEVAQSEGRDFIAMEFVAGQTLRARLKQGPLKPREALKIALEVAEALEKAHNAGIVHRDLKPENIMLSDEGHVKVMDFGLAKHTGDGRGEATQNTTSLTREGTLPGTPAYMSPEQLRGAELSPRSDIFSFGVVLYEILTGVHPFKRQSPFESIHAILSDPAPPLTQYGDSIPDSIENLVGKMLAKEPERRYQLVQEVHADLSRVLEGGRDPRSISVFHPSWKLARPFWLVMVFVAAAFFFASLTFYVYEHYFRAPPPVLGFQNRDWILITDFQNHTQDERLDRSLSLALTIGIQQSRHVNVLPRARISDALRRMLMPETTVVDEVIGSEIALREGARAVLTGSVGQVGERYLLTVQLVDPENQIVVHSEMATADRMEQVLDSLDGLARRIRRKLGESLANIRRLGLPLPGATTRSLDALFAFSRARMAEGNARLEFLKEAIDRDPEFALAHADLGVEYYIGNNRPEGEKHFREALRLMDRLTLREQLWVQSVVEDWRGNREEAIVKYGIYLAEYPDDAWAWFRLGWAFQIEGRYADGVDAFKEALRIRPSDANAHINLASCFGGLRRFEDALVHYSRAFELNPETETGHYVNHEYGFLLVKLGRIEEARKAFRKMLQLDDGRRARGYRSLALLEMYLGRYSGAVEFLRQAIALNQALRFGMSEFRDRLYLANLWKTRGFHREFEEEMGEVARLESQVQLAPSWLHLLGRTYARNGRVENASEVLRRLSERLQVPEAVSALGRSHQQDEEAHQLLKGEIELGRGENASAIQSFRVAETLGSKHSIEALAHAHHLSRDHQRAILGYEKLIAENQLGYELQESTVLALYHLGGLYDELGQHGKAAESYARFLEIWRDADPDLAPVVEAKGRLGM